MSAILTSSPYLDGHIQADHPLSPRTALASLDPLVKQILGYSPQSLWDIETARLPRRLQAYRHKARAYAQNQLAPVSLEVDALPHPAAGQLSPQLLALVQEAGRQGWLTDIVPGPFGSCGLLDALHPMALRTALKVEEFSRACGYSNTDVWKERRF